MPLSAKERLQRRLAEKKKATGIASEASISQPNDQEQLKCFAWDNSVPTAMLDAAENCHRSLVEELLPLHYPEFLNAPYWSLHRKLTAISLSPSRQFRRIWKELVEKFDLSEYFRLQQREIKAKLRRVLNNRADCLLVEIACSQIDYRLKAFVASHQMSVSDRLLLRIFAQLDGIASMSVGGVCRRWHFVGRCMWNCSFHLELTDSEANGLPRLTSIESTLRLSKITYRFCLSTLVLAGDICVKVEHLTVESVMAIRLTVLVCCGVRFVSTQMSISAVNNKIRNFVQELVKLQVLVLLNIEICSVNNLRNRKEVRSLDLRWSLEQTAIKVLPRAYLYCLSLSLDAFHHHDKATFEKFCQEVVTLKTERIIFYGSRTPNASSGLSESIFTLCLADLMHRLRELSLCRIVFSDGTRLKSSSVDLLAGKIMRDSNLHLFCLIEGEISEHAVYNLQRCANLQIIILLRCEIVSKDPDLSLLAGWHPTITRPGLLITDRQTFPRWIKPVYFPVFRIASFTDLGTDKFLPIRKSCWTIQSLLNAFDLGLPDLRRSLPPECEAEDVLMDAAWFRGTCFSEEDVQNLRNMAEDI